MLVITILYDNLSFDPTLQSGWGFACMIEGLEKTILFDSGGNGEILLSNMKRLGIAPKDVDFIVLSHEHKDHTGGLDSFLSEGSQARVFLPASFSLEIKGMVKSSGGDYVEVSQLVKICKDVYSTGELGSLIREQGLVIKVSKGLIVITGCAHPGIVHMLEALKEEFRESFYLVLGGLHLFNLREDEIEGTIERLKEIGVLKLAPAHCSGDKARELIEKHYGEHFVKLGVGAKVMVA